MSFKQRHILILGGSSDIGLEVIKKLLKLNWKVTAHYNYNKFFLKNIKNKNLYNIFLDFSKINYKNINKIFKKKFNNNYDAIVNLIGYVDNKSYQKTDLESLIKSIKINALLPILIQKKLVGNMLAKKWGRILNCSSIGVKFGGGINAYNYAFSKHCLEFFPNIHKEWAKKNVLINSLRIGITDTKLHKRMNKKMSMRKRINLIPIKRMAKPQEISNYIVNLVVDENSYMTGQTISISGGE